jgi:hypothetical protein
MQALLRCRFGNYPVNPKTALLMKAEHIIRAVVCLSPIPEKSLQDYSSPRRSPQNRPWVQISDEQNKKAVVAV